MSALPLPLPENRELTILNAVTREIESENNQSAKSIVLALAMSNLRRVLGEIAHRPDDLEPHIVRGLWALHRAREAEEHFTLAEAHCRQERKSLMEQAAKAMGVCVVCSQTTSDGMCEDCRDVMLGDVM